MKAALVHYWFVRKRGGELVVEALGRLLPDADLISHIVDRKVLFGSLTERKVIETFISRLPWARKYYPAYLPLMPLALESLDMNGYDLIVSSEAGPAKWIIPPPNARHVCYCHSPMRYIWDQRGIYFRSLPAPLRPLAELYASHLRRSDTLSATRVDSFVANSRFVARRIEKYYRREAEIVHPPVDIGDFKPAEDGPENFYLIAGELASYKRVDLAIQACNRLGRRLKVLGGGGAMTSLKAMAGPTIEFAGRVSDAEFRDALARCRALLFPGLEDFGIVPVEAMASGRPVIAFGEGGALDSVVPEKTGLLFHQQTVKALESAILEFESEERHFKVGDCVAQAHLFDRSIFDKKMSGILGLSSVQTPKVPQDYRISAD